MNYFEEKEEKWGKLRWGMFTGSRISELFVMDKNGCFGKGAMSYINKVACESYTEYEHNEFKGTWQMRQGKINEPMCAKYYFSWLTKRSITQKKWLLSQQKSPYIIQVKIRFETNSDKITSIGAVLFKILINFFILKYLITNIKNNI